MNVLNIIGWMKGGVPTPVDATKATRLPTRDDYSVVEHTPDQIGDDSVKTFVLTTPGDFVMVDIDAVAGNDYLNYRARATIDGSTPTETLGFVCRSGGTSYLAFPMIGNDVKVYLPAGTVGAVQVGRYA